jgi:hypothetical protein
MSEDLRELLAELENGATLITVLTHAMERGRTQGYQHGQQAGYLQACDEAEWRLEARKLSAH